MSVVDHETATAVRAAVVDVLIAEGIDELKDLGLTDENSEVLRSGLFPDTYYVGIKVDVLDTLIEVQWIDDRYWVVGEMDYEDLEENDEE